AHGIDPVTEPIPVAPAAHSGYAAGAAQAHATALGLRSRPIGSWQQADLGAALGDAPGRDWIIHGLALAAPPAPPESPHQRTPHPAPPTSSGKEERP
ncbi:nitroreductase, partial [Streptomyces cavourensis]|nr:nitroreductase [Streptomyces cavourensis]